MDVPNTFPGLFWGYSIIWAILVIYIATLGIRLSKLEKSTSSKKE